VDCGWARLGSGGGEWGEGDGSTKELRNAATLPRWITICMKGSTALDLGVGEVPG
jgi:hypothetical protein